jgi:DNA-binding transcriptional MerR regulator
LYWQDIEMIAEKNLRIGELTPLLGLSSDTLRYYEKIGLLGTIGRSAGGSRFYTRYDVSRLRFIQRAKEMNFSLDEIGQLLSFRDDPQHSREETRELTRSKLAIIEQKARQLETLKNELTLLLNLCGCSEAGCPIIEHLDDDN